MPHQLTIAQKNCHGLVNCRACEIVAPGLVNHCANYGRLILGDWAMQDYSAKISALVTACPARAIMIKPINQ
jgi:hypothetical protein